MADQLSDRIDALYQLSLDEFIAARDALARELRGDGDRGAAAAVKKLAKPSVTAWAVNLLWGKYPEDFGALVEAGDRLRDAQESAGGDFGAAIEDRRDCLSQLMELAEGILDEGGHGSSRPNLQRISQTLEALSVLEARQVEEPPGRLTRDLQAPGFEALSPFAPAPTNAGTTAGAAAAGELDAWAEAEAATDREESADRAREEKKRGAAEKKAALKNAQKRVAELKDENAALRRKAKATARVLAKAEREHEKAAQRAENAAKTLEAAAHDAEEADWALEQARRELKDAQRRVHDLRK